MYYTTTNTFNNSFATTEALLPMEVLIRFWPNHRQSPLASWTQVSQLLWHRSSPSAKRFYERNGHSGRTMRLTQRSRASFSSQAILLGVHGFAIGIKYWPRRSSSRTSRLAARKIAVAAASSRLCPRIEKTALIIAPIGFPNMSFHPFHCSVTMLPGKKQLTYIFLFAGSSPC